MNRIKALTQKFLRNEEAAVVTEYGMLIVVVVIGMAAVLGIYRNNISAWFNNITTNLNNIT
jgi:Flp pilus assembly pilin Flp